MTKYLVVWNEGRTEGFVTTSIEDAKTAKTGKPSRVRGYSSYSQAALGFYEAYKGDKFTTQKVDIA